MKLFHVACWDDHQMPKRFLWVYADHDRDAMARASAYTKGAYSYDAVEAGRISAELRELLYRAVTPDMEADQDITEARRLFDLKRSDMKHVAYTPRSGTSSEADAQ